MSRTFWRLWAGETVSLLGTGISGLLISLTAAISLHAGAFWVGAIQAATWAPWLVFGLIAGVWADAAVPRRTMIAADLVAAAALVTVPLAWLAGYLTLAQLVLVSLVTGTAGAFFKSAYPSQVAHVVKPAELERANAWLSGSESATFVAGPPLAGILASILAPALGVLIDVAGYLVSALCLRRQPSPKRHLDPAAEPIRSRVRVGIAYLWSDRLLRWFTIQGSISNIGLTGFQTLLALFLLRDARLSPGWFGVALMCNSAGSVVGAAVAPWLSRRWGNSRMILRLQVALGFVVLLVPLGGSGVAVWPSLVGIIGTGFCVVAPNVVRSSWRQSYVPPELLGRSISASQTLNFAFMPLAALSAGALGELCGLRAAIAVMCGVVTLASTAALIGPLHTLRVLPTGRSMPRSPEPCKTAI